MVYWVQDSQKISRETTLDGIDHKTTSKENIDAARVQGAICKHNDDESDSLIKAADPGNINKQKECISWSQSLRKYL